MLKRKAMEQECEAYFNWYFEASKRNSESTIASLRETNWQLSEDFQIGTILRLPRALSLAPSAPSCSSECPQCSPRYLSKLHFIIPSLISRQQASHTALP